MLKKLFLLLVMALFLAGCGTDQVALEKAKAEQAAAQAQQAQSEAMQAQANANAEQARAAQAQAAAEQERERTAQQQNPLTLIISLAVLAFAFLAFFGYLVFYYQVERLKAQAVQQPQQQIVYLIAPPAHNSLQPGRTQTGLMIRPNSGNTGTQVVYMGREEIHVQR